MSVFLSRPLVLQFPRPPALKEPAGLKPKLTRVLFDLGREVLHVLNDVLDRSKIAGALHEPLSSLSSDEWGFGYVWFEVKSTCKDLDSLYALLQKRKEEIAQIREETRVKLRPIPALDGLPCDLSSGTIFIDSSRIVAISYSGISGSYFLLDEKGQPIFVVKPMDEDIGALHNPKGYSSPFETSFIREGISLYASVFREVAVWHIASAMRLTSIAPPTYLAILHSDRFYDLSKQVSAKEFLRFNERLGNPDFEKLCSIQQYVPNSKSLMEAMQELQAAGLSDEEIAGLFDQKDFEEANLLLWLTGETDGHLGNFLVYPKTYDEIGNQILGIQKIDNGLAFPEINKGFRNSLSHLPNANRALSQETLMKVHLINVDQLANILCENELTSAIISMRERIEKLQSLLQQNPSLTIKQINSELSKLSYEWKKPHEKSI